MDLSLSLQGLVLQGFAQQAFAEEKEHEELDGEKDREINRKTGGTVDRKTEQEKKEEKKGSIQLHI